MKSVKLVLLPIPMYIDMDKSHKEYPFLKHELTSHDDENCMFCEHAKNQGKKAAMRGGLRTDNPYHRTDSLDSKLWLEGFESVKVIDTQ